MKLSENWLRSRLSLDHVEHAALRERLDMIGHEVEAVEVLGEGLQGVVVAEILACARHPQADRLQVCEVDAGGEHLQIVCGAPNARAGLKAPLATLGARLGELVIRAAKLRGVESFGMLCSARELGLEADASGLLELPADAPVGTPLAAYLGLPDRVLDLGLTPNRGDCLSLEGAAADLAAAFAVPFEPLSVAPVAPSSERRIEVRLEAPADCPRYCGRYILDVDAGRPSPLWMRERLRRAGLRPHSLLVDVTNYVMLELGQPLHAFDAERLQGPIGVRRARVGERLRLLDEREVALGPEFLLITDADRPIALAGLMGGWDSRIDDASRSVFLEAAYFAPAALAGRARQLGMATDAAHRFERGVDPELPRRALERAAGLILQIGGGKAGPIVEALSAEHLPVRAPVALRRARISRVLGITIGDAEVERILRALDMRVEASAEGWRATPPSRRFDVAIEEDLIEEIARIHGYQRIPDRAPSGQLIGPVLREDRVETRRLRDQLAARGYFEALTYAFVSRAELEAWRVGDCALALSNPLSVDMAVMRTSLLPGLAAALLRNRSRQQERVRLFELGRVYLEGEGVDAGGRRPVREIRRLAGIACGPARAEQWGEAARGIDFFDLKGDIESLLALTGTPVEFEFVAATGAWLHPGQCAEIRRGGQIVGIAGAVHPEITRKLGLDGDLFAFEFDLDPLCARRVPLAAPLSRFPSVRRDLSIELPIEVSFAVVERAVREAVGPLLVDLVLFDRYMGEKLAPGRKSYAIGLILQDASRTLEDSDAERATALAVTALETVCNARLRG